MRSTPDFDEVLARLGLAEARATNTPAVPTKRASDTPLMDLVQATSFKKALWGTKLSEKAQRILFSYRNKLRRAERFVMDDEAARLTCHLSHEQDRLPAWSMLARLPYDTFWLEFSARARVAEFQKMGVNQRGLNDLNEVTETVGFLFFMDESETRWIAHEFVKTDDGEAMPGFIAFVFDPAGDPMYPVRGSAYWNMPTLSLRPGFPKQRVIIGTKDQVSDGGAAVAYTDPEFGLCGLYNFRGEADENGMLRIPARRLADGMIEIPDASDLLRAPDWFCARAAAIVDPFWHFHFERIPNKLNALVSGQVSEEAGMLRYLVTLLAAINALPKVVKPVQTKTGTQNVPGRLHNLPFMRHRNLTLEIPRDNRVVWARKAISREVSNRKLAWHPVRNHWRVIEYGKAGGRVCRHVPTLQDGDVAMCVNCEMLIRWIKLPEGRGDPSIGVVDRTYKIKKRKGQSLSP